MGGGSEGGVQVGGSFNGGTFYRRRNFAHCLLKVYVIGKYTDVSGGFFYGARGGGGTIG